MYTNFHSVSQRPALHRKIVLPRPHEEVFHSRGQTLGLASKGKLGNQHADLHRQVQIDKMKVYASRRCRHILRSIKRPQLTLGMDFQYQIQRTEKRA